MSIVLAQVQDVEEGYEVTTTGGGGALASAAPQPALVPQLRPFLVRDPPESVTVSIIIDNNDGASSKCRVENEEDGNDEEMDEEEEERLGAWIYKQSCTAKKAAAVVA